MSDFIEHEVSEDCICGPTAEPVERPDGSIGWHYTHHSLDGREATTHRREREATATVCQWPVGELMTWCRQPAVATCFIPRGRWWSICEAHTGQALDEGMPVRQDAGQAGAGAPAMPSEGGGQGLEVSEAQGGVEARPRIARLGGRRYPEAAACVHCSAPVRPTSYAYGPSLQHYNPNAAFNDATWEHCRLTVATAPGDGHPA